ncbi:hypothetical protein Z962_07835 [Clostridium botulinum C/D str. BKT12695]|nr:hypothetical protein Z962_07835 [Clostridium botulinum C/D str. BKT12695]
MEKLLKQQAKNLQKELNIRGNGDIIFKVSVIPLTNEIEEDFGMKIKIIDLEHEKQYTYLTINVCEDFESNIKNLIYQIYDVDINKRRNITRNWHSYISNYINSLENALDKENVDNIIDVNIRILEQSRKVKETQAEIDYFMNFVHALYDARDVLCPQEIKQAI